MNPIAGTMTTMHVASPRYTAIRNLHAAAISPAPTSARLVEPGSPRRFGLSVAAAPAGSVARSWSIPRSTRKRCSLSVRTPISSTTAAAATPAAFREAGIVLGSSSNKAAPARTSESDMFVFIVITPAADQRAAMPHSHATK